MGDDVCFPEFPTVHASHDGGASASAATPGPASLAYPSVRRNVPTVKRLSASSLLLSPHESIRLRACQKGCFFAESAEKGRVSTYARAKGLFQSESAENGRLPRMSEKGWSGAQGWKVTEECGRSEHQRTLGLGFRVLGFGV
eukprot:92420-Chlamydomonas_euryale.AAC.1